MDEKSRCGAVAFMEGIAHPISVARAVMETTQHVMLVGEGAEKFAIEKGFEQAKMPIPEVKKDWQNWKKENKDVFKNSIKGYISYFRGAPSYVFPEMKLKYVRKISNRVRHGHIQTF